MEELERNVRLLSHYVGFHRLAYLLPPSIEGACNIFPELVEIAKAKLVVVVDFVGVLTSLCYLSVGYCVGVF